MLKIFRIINLVSGICLLLGYMAQYVPANRLWWLLIFGHSQIIWLFINVFWVIFWLFKKQKSWFLFSFAIIILGYRQNAPLINFNINNKTDTAQTIKIMSYNVQMLTHKGNGKNRNEILEGVFQLVKTTNPDIVGFQEFTNPKRSIKHTGLNHHIRLIEDFSKRQNLKYQFFHPLSGIGTSGQQRIGIAVLSKFPIINKGVVDYFSTSKAINACIFADIKLPYGDTVRVFNLHYNSNLLNKEDYYYIENIGEDDLMSSGKGLKNILKKLKNSSIIRSNQAQKVAEAISQSPYKVIVLGDFNDPPSSYAYRKTANGLKDAFIERGFGLSQTYIGPYPSFRIDHILADKSFEVINYKVIRQELSDHYPISATLKLPEKVID